MTTKQREELELVRHLLSALGYQNFRLDFGDRPDILATVDNRRIGIEVTALHVDEGRVRKGSLLRAEEEKKAKNAQAQPYVMWGNINYLRALRFRIDEKIERAAKFDEKKFDELWLLLASQLPKPGAVASTFVVPALVDVNDLNQLFHERLFNSCFRAAYLHLLIDHALYAWNPLEMWRGVGIPEQRPSSVSGLWFKDILRDPDWLRDPDGKARQEASRVIDELIAAKELKVC